MDSSMEPATDPPISPTPPTAPPTVPAALPSRKAVWPLVLGVIAIVFGSLGVLGGVVGAVAVVVAGEIMGEAVGGPLGIANQVFGFVLSILLLIGGIGLTRRSRWAPRLVLIWAGLMIISSLIGTVIGYQVQQEQMQELQARGGPAPAWIGASMPFFMLLGLLWALALPVFMIIWLRRPTIRAEIAGWR